MSAPAVPAAPEKRVDRWAALGPGGLLVAGAAHLLAALDHLTHDPRFAVFFLVVGAAQLVGAPALRRGARPAFVVAAVASTVALLLLYVASRTVVLPLGPHADRPEDPDLLGTVVVLGEVVALAVLPRLLPPAHRRAVANGVLLVGIGVWVAWLTGLLG